MDSPQIPTPTPAPAPLPQTEPRKRHTVRNVFLALLLLLILLALSFLFLLPRVHAPEQISDTAMQASSIPLIASSSAVSSTASSAPAREEWPTEEVALPSDYPSDIFPLPSDVKIVAAQKGNDEIGEYYLVRWTTPQSWATAFGTQRDALWQQQWLLSVAAEGGTDRGPGAAMNMYKTHEDNVEYETLLMFYFLQASDGTSTNVELKIYPDYKPY